jgi:uncharacterized protein (TIGR02145 family)
MKKQLCDERDGKKYFYVVIGEGETAQTWMAENLNYNVEGSKCYDNEDENCETYGKLYNWATAMNLASSCNSSICSVQTKHRGVCPSGWHIPSDAERSVLAAVGGKKLNAENGWSSSGNGTDDYGFSALPGGYGQSNGSFIHVGNYGYWWSATESGYTAIYAYFIGIQYTGYVAWIYDIKSSLRSVRCVQD